MTPFLALHGLAVQRGEGLRPELCTLMQRYRRPEASSISPISQDLAEAFLHSDALCALTAIPDRR